jgi:hypothetical protein
VLQSATREDELDESGSLQLEHPLAHALAHGVLIVPHRSGDDRADPVQ